MFYKKSAAIFSEIYNSSKWVIALYIKIAPRLTSLYVFTQAILRLEPILNAYLFGVIIDRSIAIVNAGTKDVTPFIPLVGLMLLMKIIFNCIRIISNNAMRILSLYDSWRFRMLLYEHLKTLGIAALENPEVANRTTRFNELIPSITNHLGYIVRIIGGLVALVSSTAVVIASAPGAVPFFILAAFVQWLIDQNFIRKLWSFSLANTEYRRKSNNHAQHLSDPAYLKELVATGGYEYLHSKYNHFVGWYVGQFKRIRKNWVKADIIGQFVESFAWGVGLLYIFNKLINGIISIGNVTFEFRALTIFAESLSGVAADVVGMRESAIRLNDSIELFTNFTPEIDGTVALDKSNLPPLIEFKNVTFHYPLSANPVLKRLNLIIKPGEKIAIVGENGAGKTTLVKLISRYYKPTKGSIQIDEIDINNIKINSWYKKLGVLFQDFNQYGQLSAKANIAIGDPSKKVKLQNIKEAASKANALEFIEEYPHKFHQLLSERYEEGIRPSTGQWQKIAIARFFYRNAPVLILDEPTASIDAQAEAQIFDNIYKFIKDKTVIIISHRFSTVRNADRIIVLDKGKIIEDGSHEELLKKNGKYARAFKVQAKGYK